MVTKALLAGIWKSKLLGGFGSCVNHFRKTCRGEVEIADQYQYLDLSVLAARNVTFRQVNE